MGDASQYDLSGNTLVVDGFVIAKTNTTLVSHAGTITKDVATITTEALTTAAGASQAFVITSAGVSAGDPVFVQGAGSGTNTNKSHVYHAVTTANTITVTVTNIHAADALDGTLVFSLWVLKA